MNAAIRRARLRGAREAERVLSILEVRDRLPATFERVDVFDALAWLDVRVVFKPLRGLLGAFIRGAQPGAMISTQRQLSVQRFTAAHELGHAILGHEPSLDSPDVLRRAAFNQPAAKTPGFASYLQEIEADAFASSFLLPIWLVTRHARKQGWNKADLAREDVVYQLSLRCGASFQATILALERHGFIDEGTRSTLLRVKPKNLKNQLRNGKPLSVSRSDAWMLAAGEAGGQTPLVVGDTVTINLEQYAGSGYLFEAVAAPGSPLTLVDEETHLDETKVGGHSTKVYVFRADRAGNARAVFEHKRPWEGEALQRAEYELIIADPEEGLSRANRARMMERGSERQRNDAD